MAIFFGWSFFLSFFLCKSIIYRLQYIDLITSEKKHDAHINVQKI